jgi:hypothetical protein
VTGVNATFAQQITDFVFHCPAATLSKDIAAAGIPIWRYRYMGAFPSVSAYPWIKAAHGQELPMVFGSLRTLQFQEPQEAEIKAMRLMMKAWVAFAKKPETGLQDEMGWPRYDPEKNGTLVELFKDNLPKSRSGTPKITIVSVRTWDHPMGCTGPIANNPLARHNSRCQEILPPPSLGTCSRS